jgi:ribosomal protein S18 acetylase RimI-like enzyme
MDGMPESLSIRPISVLAVSADHLIAAARSEGYRFVDRLFDEWRSGSNCFAGDGEAFLGAFSSGMLIAFGGLNRDPYRNQRVARIRHVYVLPEYRRKGVGRQLVAAILSIGENRYRYVRLRASDGTAANFYKALGFTRTNEVDSTHALICAARSGENQNDPGLPHYLL